MYISYHVIMKLLPLSGDSTFFLLNVGVTENRGEVQLFGF